MFKRSFLAAMPAALGLACAAEAAVITVDTFAPLRMRCNLASALAAAERNQPVEGCAAGEGGGVDEIRFRPTLTGTATLSRPTLVTDSVRIIGNGRDLIAIEGGLVVQTDADGEFVLQGVTMRSGLLLWRAGEVSVEGVRFANLPNQMLHGSAIATPMATIGRLSIRDSEFLGNAGDLGVVALSPDARIDEVEIVRSRFAGNQTDGRGSGALYVGAQTAQVTIDASDFVGNKAWSGRAGAIAVEQPTTLSIQASVFDNNEGGEAGAIWAYGSGVDIVNSALTRNRGGQAAALYLIGGHYFGLRFSSVVDNGGGAPALNLDIGPGAVEFLGNVLRAPAYGRVCGYAPIQSLGYNQQYGGYTCELYAHGDLNYLSYPLSSVPAGAGRPRVPAPIAHGPGVDRVPFYECALSSWEPLASDIRDLERPWNYGQVDPSGWCDVGPVERRTGDLPAPIWY